MNETELQVRKFYSEIWNKKNLQQIPNIIEPNFEFRGSVGHTKHGHDGFQEYVLFIHDALTDYHCEIQDIVIEPNKAFAKMLFSGIHTGEFMGYAATHKNVSWSAAALFNFNNGKISSLWVLGDLVSLEQQLNLKA